MDGLSWAVALIGALSGSLVTFLLCFRTIHSLKAQLRTDLVTGLANQKQIIESGSTLLDRTFSSRRMPERRRRLSDQIVAVIFLDLDAFKNVNDTYGHAEGDKVLQLLADRLREQFREGEGVFGRWAGDEFVLVIPGLEEEKVMNRMRYLEESFRRVLPVYLYVQGLGLTFGVCMITERTTLHEAIMKADQAMLSEKERKRKLRDDSRR